MQETQETWVRSLGWEDPLEEGLAAHSSVLAGKSHEERNLEGYSPWGRRESASTEHARTLLLPLPELPFPYCPQSIEILN